MKNIKDYQSRIKEYPICLSWDCAGSADSFREKGKIDYSDLSDEEKLCLFVYAWNRSDICPRKKTIQDEFGWSAYKVSKLAKECKRIEVVTTVNERTGMLSGRGYLLAVPSNLAVPVNEKKEG